MKRFLKVLVASITSLCLMALNLPLMEGVVWADYELPDEAKYSEVNYQGNLSFMNCGDFARLENNDGTIYASPDNKIALEPCTITIGNAMEPGTVPDIDCLLLYLDDELVCEHKSNEGISEFFTLEEYAEFTGIQTGASDDYDGNVVARIYLKSIYKFELSTEIYRSFEFFSGNYSVGIFSLGGPDEPTSLTVYFGDKPDSLKLSAPGGVGANEYGRLNSVSIGGTSKDIQSRYGNNEFALSGAAGTSTGIVVNGDDTAGYLIEWVNDGGIPKNNLSEENVLHGGSAYLSAVYIKNANGDWVEDPLYTREDGFVDGDGYASIHVPVGSKVEFRFKPLPGYQLTELLGIQVDTSGQPVNGVNGTVLEAGTELNTYSFVMPANNLHFDAKFELSANLVKVDGKSIVEDGELDLDINEFEGGIAQMTVDSLSEAEQANYENSEDFADQLGEGDNVEAFLKIDIKNAYRQANTEDGYWLTDAPDLENGAIVSLVLDDDFTPEGEYLYIVHEYEDGKYENIPADYDADTNTVSFETGSFSPFMIVSSNEEIEPDDCIRLNIDFVPENESFVVGSWVEDLEAEEEDWNFVLTEQGEIFPEGTIIDLSWGIVDDKLTERDFNINIDGETVAVLAVADEADKEYTFEQMVIFDSIEETEETIEVNFISCYVLTFDFNADIEVKVLDASGNEMKPLNAPEGYPIIKSTGEPVELYFASRPSSMSVKGNGYAITSLLYEGNEVKTPIGENVIEYPKDVKNTFWIWGEGEEYKPGDVLNLTSSVEKATVTYAGLSETDAKKYALVIKDYTSSEEYLAKVKQYLNTKGYNDVGFVLCLDISLYDQAGLVPEPGFDVTITLKLTKALNLKDGEKVYIYHPHGDSVEVLEATYNAADQTITFTTRSFSPFITFKATKTNASVPSTGENAGYTTLAGLALIAAAGLVFVRKKEMDLKYSREDDAT